MERPVISFIKGANVRPKPDTRVEVPEEELKRRIYAHEYSNIKSEDLLTSELGDRGIYIEEF